MKKLLTFYDCVDCLLTLAGCVQEGHGLYDAKMSASVAESVGRP